MTAKPIHLKLEMKRIRLDIRGDAERSYDVLVGRGLLGNLHNEINKLGDFSSIALVTDEVVKPLIAAPLQAQLRSHDLEAILLTLPAGEAAKTMETVTELCQQLVGHGFDRKSLLLAVGGGVVGDITGFAAAIYLRGIRYIQVPTTLLAQVDSSIGGKTGVDLLSGKNLLGAFNQPLLVVSDPDLLVTLPLATKLEGVAEVIKAALIGSPELFRILEREGPGILEVDNPLLEAVIVKACEVKCQVVSQDAHEAGLRRILNFGHTLGHAVEAASDYNVSHGQAVAAGMGIAIRFSRQWAGFSEDEANRALSLTRMFSLPTELPEHLDSEALMNALEKDKKIQSGVCHFVLLSRIGKPIIHPIPVEELRRNLKK
jgi:3-dehydroquinate synthase